MGKGSKKKPPPEKPDWEKLEIVVAEIQKALAPKAEIRHNHHVIGKSGRRRQLDVTISQKIGSVPAFIVVECKRYKKAVGIEKVEAFAKKLEDVRAIYGVMISSAGFDAGAKAVAAQENIILQTYRQAEETDWERLVGPGSWLNFHIHDFSFSEAGATLGERRIRSKLSFETAIYDADRRPFGPDKSKPVSLRNLFWDAWRNSERPRTIGHIRMEIERNGADIHVEMDGELLVVHEFTILGEMVVQRYVYNLQFEEGQLLEDMDNDQPEYLEMTTKGFNLDHIKQAQEGMKLTQEQWNEVERTALGEMEMHQEALYRFKLIGGQAVP